MSKNKNSMPAIVSGIWYEKVRRILLFSLYVVYVGNSSQDIRLTQTVYYNELSTYSIDTDRDAMIG